MATVAIENEGIEELLDSVMAHKSERIKCFLDQRGLKKSGTKEDLRDILRGFLEEHKKNSLPLTEYLNLIDGWGNQHIYLYAAPAGLSASWQVESQVKDVLKANKLSSIFNNPRSVVLPDEPTLASIAWTSAHVRFTWNERREWQERREESDKIASGGKIIYKAWERKIARGTVAFDWNLETGEAMLMIQRLQHGAQYEKIRNRFVEKLRPIVDLNTFTLVRISKAIKPLLKGDEVRERRAVWETLKGGQATFSSAKKDEAVSEDETLQKMESAGKSDMQGSLANIYWLPKREGGLTEELHTILHRKDQRIAIMGERAKEEVLYVTGRIRAYTK